MFPISFCLRAYYLSMTITVVLKCTYLHLSQVNLLLNFQQFQCELYYALLRYLSHVSSGPSSASLLAQLVEHSAVNSPRHDPYEHVTERSTVRPRSGEHMFCTDFEIFLSRETLQQTTNLKFYHPLLLDRFE